jgi:glycosyltransferase involved in cell wall biosynthesis
MKKIKSLSLCFPAYNEERIITKTVEEATIVGNLFCENFEIVIVDDGSKDKTPIILDYLSKTNNRLKVIHQKLNKGYGAALSKVLHSATKELIFFSDSDLQFNLREITKLIKYINDYDVVIGYRNNRKDPYIRLINAKLWGVLNRIFFGLKVRDIDCAFKLFHHRVINDLQLESHGAMVSAEMLIKIFDLGYKVKEVPVTHLPSPNKTFGTTGAKPTVIVKALKELITFRRNYRSK